VFLGLASRKLVLVKSSGKGWNLRMQELHIGIIHIVGDLNLVKVRQVHDEELHLVALGSEKGCIKDTFNSLCTEEAHGEPVELR
jgi:hypothetical protein